MRPWLVVLGEEGSGNVSDYAATTDDDAARVRECLADCAYSEIDSGHDIHVEHPDAFIEAVGQTV